MTKRVLVIGAMGMLAQPVVRRLVSEGFAVRAAVRSPARARRLLPPACEVVPAEVQQPRTIEKAMDSCDAVYLNLAQPPSPRSFDPDVAAAKLVSERGPRLGVTRIMRISTMGLPGGARSWWVAQRKQEADELVRASEASHTIFHPTWFMESLPLFLVGRRIMLPETSHEPLYWLAGEDYARQVCAALRSEHAINRTYVAQGKYPLSMQHAVIRLAMSYDSSLSLLRVPRWMLRTASVFSAKPRYLRDLLAFTFTHCTGFHAQETFTALGEPLMTIEDYARGIRASGDVPRK